MVDNWIDLNEVWDFLKTHAQKRDSQKRNYKSTKNWSKYSTHFIGLLSEYVFGKTYGYEVNLDLLQAGDKGFDFNTPYGKIDVKGTQYYKDPILKQYPKPKHWSDRYYLVGIDVNNKKGKVFGWASRDQMMKAKKIDYGYGPQLSIHYKDLHEV